MRDLQKTYWNCIGLLDEIGMDYGTIISVTVNTRAKKRWGQCKGTYVGRASNGEPRYEFTINISSILLDEKIASIEGLQNTIIHEILHTCPGCQNHGPEWKRRAAIVKKKLGYDIQRCNSAEEKGIDPKISEKIYKPKIAKYEVKCKKCGFIYTRSKMSNLIKYTSHYRCGKCRGELELIN